MMSAGERLLGPVGGDVAIWELDLLVLLMCVAVALHSVQWQCNQWRLLATGLTLGYVVETLSLHFGGTHCHASGLLNFSECSSANSVFFYIIWIYCSIVAGRRLVDERSFAFPFFCGFLFFGISGIYACIGPLMRWWLWPDVNGVVKLGSTFQQFGELADDTRGMVVTPHAMDALADRIYEIPVLAPYFHMACGWGVALAFQIVGFDGSLLQHLIPAFLGPALAMLWEPPLRLTMYILGANIFSVAPTIWLAALMIVLLAGPRLKYNSRRDSLLLFIPLLNTTFFLYQAIFGRAADVIPGNLKVVLVSLSVVALAAYSRASGNSLSKSTL